MSLFFEILLKVLDAGDKLMGILSAIIVLRTAFGKKQDNENDHRE